ncbi:MAG: aroA [Chitinophagaceae bacterium]|nr:aroA [Chitinophagaceae bacterium]
MQAIITPSNVSGNIIAPASKSSMQRACAAALIRTGETLIRNPGTSNDDKAALNVIKALGAEIKNDGASLRIISKGIKPIADQVNCGESGLGIRMFAPLISLSEKTITIHGEGSLLNRPMDFFDEIFPELGIKISSNKGKLPLQITGPLQPKNITIDGSLSSQFLTGLLFAYAAQGADNVTITVNNLKSKPYVDLTLKVMENFGLQLPQNNNYESFFFSHNSNNRTSDFIDYTVEGDWSGGAFLLVAGAIAGNITVKGLDTNSTQADKAILQALVDCGSKLSVLPNEITIGKNNLKGFHFNATNCPDLFPPLVALAAFCEGTTVIEGVSRLMHKESNRGLTLQDEFGKMGVKIELQDDLMIIKETASVSGALVESRHDHRIAMACAVAGLEAKGNVIIDDAEAINKSYPAFYEDLQKLGAGVTLKE